MKRDESRSETDFGRPGSLWGSGAKGKTRTSWGFSGPMGLISLIRIESGREYNLIDKLLILLHLFMKIKFTPTFPPTVYQNVSPIGALHAGMATKNIGHISTSQPSTLIWI